MFKGNLTGYNTTTGKYTKFKFSSFTMFTTITNPAKTSVAVRDYDETIVLFNGSCGQPMKWHRVKGNISLQVT